MKGAGIIVASSVLAWVAACGSSDSESDSKEAIPAPVTFASGSRLKARFLEADGVKAFYGWQDALLGKPCLFVEGRCLAGAVQIVRERDVFFEDDACTAAVIPAPETFQALDAVMFVAYEGQCSVGTLRTPGDRIPMPPQLYSKISGSCMPVSPFPTPPTGEYVRVGAPIPPESEPFVRGAEQNDPPDGRIVARWFVAEDGARQLVGAWDSERNEIVSTELSAKRWYPHEHATLVGESTCPGIARSSACKTSVVVSGGDGCRDPSISALGPPITDAECPSAYGAGYQVGSAIPLSSFADAKKVIVGAGRIRLVMDARADDRPLVPRGFFDTEGQTTCAPVPDDATQIDGPLHCQPDLDSRVTKAFTDEHCLEPAVLFTPGSSSCDAPKTIARFVIRDSVPFEVGAQIYAAWALDQNELCTPIELSDERTAYLATPLDRSRLAAITIRTE